MSNGGLDVAALHGSYAIAISAHAGSAPLAGFGLMRFDGAGAVVGWLSENRPAAAYGHREIVRLPLEGTYTMSGEGLGTIRFAESAEADTQIALRDVTEAGGRQTALQLALMFRARHERSGALRTGIGFRRPDNALFDTRSLHGRYNGQAVGIGGEGLVAGLGVITYDGTGGFVETNVSNVAGDSFRDRRFISGSDRGSYTIEADGTGSLSDGGLLFLITRTRPNPGVTLAEEYVFFLRDLIPSSGALITGTTRRVGD